jgi:alpha-beta hydrolase superfamily lysophospholipase
MPALKPYAVERLPIQLVFRETSAFKETYGGGMDVVVCEGQLLRPAGKPSDTLVVFMHPTGLMNLLPMTNGLAASGVHVLCAGSRYPHNDSGLIMEKVVFDLGQYVRHAREKLGYRRIVLGGWSGGGSLSLFYQSQAERPTITETPAGDPCDLVGAKLIPADGVMMLAAHVSRAITLTEWLDASIVDELDPTRRDPELDLYDPANPNQPPYTEDFLVRYRAAQVARSRRIDAWVRAELERVRKSARGEVERAFVVHGTMADPRWLDLAVDPNDRKGPNWCYMGEPRAVNTMPAGLARYSSLRSWLSQWSFDHSRADGPRCAGDIKVPYLVVENTADDACTPSHIRRLFEGYRGPDRELARIKGATHYYLGQPRQLAQAVEIVTDWMRRKLLLD